MICLKPHASKKSSSSGLSSEEVQVSANREIGRGFDGRNRISPGEMAEKN